jgi:penicillin-binding protein 1B
VKAHYIRRLSWMIDPIKALAERVKERVKAHYIRRLSWKTLFVAFSFLLCLAVLLTWRFYRRLEHEVVARFASHQWEVPSKIYADPLLLYPGVDIAEIGFLERLARLEYRSVTGRVQTRGEYQYDPQKGEIELFLREFPYPRGKKQRSPHVGVSLRDDRIERMRDLDDNTELPFIELEPEVITGLYDQAWEERRIVKLYDVPSLLMKALLAAEDQRFFEHEGIDLRRIIGAGWANFQAGRTTQGGSTLTQQLVKNFFLTQERTLRRKIVEACIALIVELHYSKLEILENYLNEIYLGQRGAKNIFGVWEAARFYFGKEPRDLALGEMAVLAGMVKAPNLYAPTRHPEAALQRRNYTLQRMRELGDITAEEYAAALHEVVSPRNLPPDVNGAPYFADFVREQLKEQYPGEVLTSEGLHVFTSLDMRLQQIAQDAVRKGLEELEAQHPRLRRSKPEERLQACLIAIQPQTGEVRAMVGGRDYQVSQFNRVTQARRQPGSVFKPIVYLTALARERERREGLFLPTSLVRDAPFTWYYGDEVWSPGNYKDKYYGTVTLRRALEKSLNAATARIARRVGLKPIRDTARHLGIVSPLPLYPSLVLGSAEVTPYEVAAAFSTLANYGIRATPLPIRRVLNQKGETVERHALHLEQTVASEDAYMLTHLLEGVLERGTGREARKLGFGRPAAGKTGTTNDFGDAWFVGYTPDLVAVVWVGFDQREPLDLSGGQAALPIWTEFMKRATQGRPMPCFVPPPGVIIPTRGSVDELNGPHSCPAATANAFYAPRELPQTDMEPPVETIPVGEPSVPPPSSYPPMPESTSVQVPFPATSAPSAPRPSRPAEARPWWRLF